MHIGPLVPHANCHPPIFHRTSRIDGIVRQSCEFLNVQSSKEFVIMVGKLTFFHKYDGNMSFITLTNIVMCHNAKKT